MRLGRAVNPFAVQSGAAVTFDLRMAVADVERAEDVADGPGEAVRSRSARNLRQTKSWDEVVTDRESGQHSPQTTPDSALWRYRDIPRYSSRLRHSARVFRREGRRGDRLRHNHGIPPPRVDCARIAITSRIVLRRTGRPSARSILPVTGTGEAFFRCGAERRSCVRRRVTVSVTGEVHGASTRRVLDADSSCSKLG